MADTVVWLLEAETLRKELAKSKTEIERLTRWEQTVAVEVEDGLRHLGDDRLADRFRDSKSPMQQRIMMVFHCLILVAEAAEGK